MKPQSSALSEETLEARRHALMPFRGSYTDRYPWSDGVMTRTCMQKDACLEKKLDHEEKLTRILNFNLVLNEHCGDKDRWLDLRQVTLLLKTNVNDKIRAHRCTNTVGSKYKAWRLPVRGKREKCQSGEQSRG